MFIRRSSTFRRPSTSAVGQRQSRSVERKSRIPVGSGQQRSKSHQSGAVNVTPLAANYLTTPVQSKNKTCTPKYSVGQIKDTRDLQDKEYIHRITAQVQTYFRRNCPEVLINGSDIRPMSMNMFVKCINHLFQTLCILHRGELVTFDNSDYCKELPLRMKDLNYPGTLSKGWLLAVSSPQYWHNVIGLLSWLVSLKECTDLYNIDEIFDNKHFNRENFDSRSGFVALLFQNVPKSAEKETNDVLEKERFKMFVGLVNNTRTVDEEELEALKQHLGQLKLQLEQLKDEETSDEYNEVLQKVQVAERQYNKTLEDIEKTVKEIQDSKQMIVKCHKKIENIETEAESKKGEIEMLKRALSEQPMSVEQVADLRKKYEYQEKENKCLQKEIEDYRLMISKTEALLSEKKDKVLQSRHAFNRKIIQLKQKIPELTSLNMYRDNEPNEALEETEKTTEFCQHLIKDYKTKCVTIERLNDDVKQLTVDRKNGFDKLCHTENEVRLNNEEIKKQIQVLEVEIQQVIAERETERKIWEEEMLENEKRLKEYEQVNTKLEQVRSERNEYVEAVKLAREMEDEFWKSVREKYESAMTKLADMQQRYNNQKSAMTDEVDNKLQLLKQKCDEVFNNIL